MKDLRKCDGFQLQSLPPAENLFVTSFTVMRHNYLGFYNTFCDDVII